MKKICTVVGARPQFIKLAVVSRVLRKEFQEVLVHTGQHYDHNMSDVFFEEMEIPRPDYNLGISGGTHGQMTGQMLIKIEEVFLHRNGPCVRPAAGLYRLRDGISETGRVGGILLSGGGPHV